MTSDGPPNLTIRILIVEGHEMACRSLVDLLNGQTDMMVVAAVGTVAAALDRVTELMPRIAVVDDRLPDGSGFALCRRIRTISPTTDCILHATVEVGSEVVDRADAAAVVLKQVIGSELVETIRKVAEGR